MFNTSLGMFFFLSFHRSSTLLSQQGMLLTTDLIHLYSKQYRRAGVIAKDLIADQNDVAVTIRDLTEGSFVNR